MPGILYDRDDDERFVSGIFGAVVGRGLTDSVRAFVEIAFEQIAGDQRGGNVGYVDFGGTFLLNPRWQLDAAAAMG
ncbi:MAG TPA: transporter, partial [Gemmatimonadetes bacterium]|nr:transporter [Gemmatimonadota bacterium]